MFSTMSILFTFILALTVAIAVSSQNMFQMWIAMEINMLTFTPMMFNKNNNNMSINSIMKYFIIQVFAGSIFIMMMTTKNFIWSDMNNLVSTLALTMKLGLFPMYFWLPQVSEGLSWASFTVLMTWQKIIPLYILSNSDKYLMTYILILSTALGCLLMVPQTSLRKILAYSSLTHMSWMLMSMLNWNNIWLAYFFIYSLMMISMYQFLNPCNTSSLYLIHMTKMSIMFLTMTLMSLSGLPPFMGFFSKWAILSTSSTNFLLSPMTLLTSSLISTFVYLRIIYPLLFSKLKLNKPIYVNSVSMNNILVTNMLTLILMAPLMT